MRPAAEIAGKLMGDRKKRPETERRTNRYREWKDFPIPAARWTLKRV
jgi:hypothetical protein